MLGTKQAAGEAVSKRCKAILSDRHHKDSINYLTSYIEKNHNIPIIISNDYISLMKNPVDAPTEILFCIMEALDQTELSERAWILPRYFDEKEIKKYSKYKYNPKKLKFPLKFEATQITDSQWIGRITVHELINLQPIIKYNPNTQRSLRRVTLNGVEVYSIFLNERALTEITEAYLNNSYIPNTITLNIPEDVDFDYEDGVLTFKALESLDIIDGYHRYVAMTRAYSADSRFDYTMEVRWTVFSEDKARQFIWQEDQKTKMTKVESASFNQNNPGNQLINMLNQVTALKDIVSVNGNVNAGVASEYINAIWFNKPKHNYTRKEIVEAKKHIEQHLLYVLDLKPDAFDKRWSAREIGGLFFIINQQDIDNVFNYIDYINKEELPIHSAATKRELSRLEEAYRNYKK